MKRFDTFGAYMFDLLFAPLKRGKRAANQFFIFFKVIVFYFVVCFFCPDYDVFLF